MAINAPRLLSRFVRTSWSLTFVAIALTLIAAKSPAQKHDLTEWRRLPVHHDGRVMPLDTFARSAAEVVCHRVNPELDLKGSLPSSDYKSDKLAGARELFPDGEARRFAASELLLSWIVEPERWEYVPFLFAPFDELREVLEVPIKNDENTFIKFVSPADVEESDKLRELIQTAGQKQQAARARGETYEPTPLEKKARELLEAYNLFRQLTYRPLETESGRNRFLEKAAAAAESWMEIRDNVTGLVAMAASDKQLAESAEQLDAAVQEVFQLGRKMRFPLKDAEPSVIKLRDSAEKLATYFGTSNERLISEGRDQLDANQFASMRKLLGRFAVVTRKLAQQGREMHIALYDPGEPLRLVPALNAAALEKDRDVADDAQPWAALPVILYGSEDLLKGYPQSEVHAVRSTFAQVAAAYRNRESSKRADEVKKQVARFSSSVRELGQAASELREDLPIKGRDDELLEYTAYPAPERIDAEVRYNSIDPFKWSWVIALGAAICFSTAFGVARKPLFWLGMAVLAFCLIWTVYGFYLRVLVTRWAPVTGMYETVIYVPTFIILLGIWFTMLPATWPGLKRAWRWSAIPFSWEATPVTDPTGDETAPARSKKGVSESDEDAKSRLLIVNCLMLIPRVALMGLTYWMLAVAPYAAGDRTIINVIPVTDVGSTLPSVNNLLVWFVGMCVLLPTIWFLPRAILAVVGSLVAVPLTLSGQRDKLMPQVYARKVFALAATFVGCLLFMIAWYAPILERGFNPLQPVLRDNFWLTIHVLTIVSSYGAGGLAWGLGNIALGFYLFGRYRAANYSRLAPVGGKFEELRAVDSSDEAAFRPRPPEATATLANYIYKVIQVAVLLLAAGTILGGLWADVSWGRFWGWDPKEVWALISLLTYLAILHGRYAGWFGNFGLAVGSVFGASAIAFSWYGVNFVLGAGLHSYGFGEGGQMEVFSGIAVNWLFVMAAAIRYWAEMNAANATITPKPQEPAAVG